MATAARQRGITLIGFIIVLAVVGFALFIGAKLFPKFDAGSYIDQGACDVDPGLPTPGGSG